MTEGIIFDIKEFTVHDGPGIRTTVFFKGCPLHCRWCHNPEGIDPAPQLMVSAGCTGCERCRKPCLHRECEPFERCVKVCPQGLVRVVGRSISPQALAMRLRRQAPLLVEGGVTISGGEPLAQPVFLLELLDELADHHTVVETSGYSPLNMFKAVALACNVLYLDLKHADGEKHRELTGVDNAPILRNLRWIMEQGIPFLVRIPLIPGCNDDMANLKRIAALLAKESALLGVELLPCNPFAGAKYAPLGMRYVLEGRGKSPSAAHDLTAPFLLQGIPCRIL